MNKLATNNSIRDTTVTNNNVNISNTHRASLNHDNGNTDSHYHTCNTNNRRHNTQ